MFFERRLRFLLASRLLALRSGLLGGLALRCFALRSGLLGGFLAFLCWHSGHPLFLDTHFTKGEMASGESDVISDDIATITKKLYHDFASSRMIL
jgi:hypothetical protein